MVSQMDALQFLAVIVINLATQILYMKIIQFQDHTLNRQSFVVMQPDRFMNFHSINSI